MVDFTRIQEHMEVLGSDGGHVGTVDHMDGQRIKLTKSDPSAGGKHHYIHIDMIASIGSEGVRLNRTTEQARDEWGS